MSIVKRFLASNVLNVNLDSEHCDLVHIQIKNLLGEPKISQWQEIEKGSNLFAIDISRLMKGTYKVVVIFSNRVKEEVFTLY